MEELTIGERIDHYLRKYRMTNADLASRVGLSKKTLIKQKKDPRWMRYDTMLKICEVLNISLETLLFGRR